MTFERNAGTEKRRYENLMRVYDKVRDIRVELKELKDNCNETEYQEHLIDLREILSQIK